MKRRAFISLLGGAATAWPLAARAQQPAVPVVGYLGPGTPEASAYLVVGFRKGLNEAGYLEGRNVTVEYRWGYNDPRRSVENAVELVRRQVTVIVAAGLNVAQEAKVATTTIPIVFNAGGDPVATGLVASLNRPGGNVTGVSSLTGELGAKRLGLLHELVPGAKHIAIMVDPITLFAKSTIEESQAAGAGIGVEIDAFTARTNREIDDAFARMVQQRSEALVVAPATLFSIRRVQITSLAMRHAVPAIYSEREFVDAGGLMSYGASLVDLYRQVGLYTGRILKGAKPADLPVVQASKFELVINAETARIFDLAVPPSLLARADEVIE
jgi:putative ABC transport system substrate-binding protein